MTLPDWKSLNTTISKLMKWRKVYEKGRKHCWKRRYCAFTSNFSFSHTIFKRLPLKTLKNKSLFRKGLSPFVPLHGSFSNKPFCAIAWLMFKQALLFTCPNYKYFENTVGEKIPRYEQFLLFSTVFSTLWKNVLPFSSNLK